MNFNSGSQIDSPHSLSFLQDVHISDALKITPRALELRALLDIPLRLYNEARNPGGKDINVNDWLNDEYTLTKTTHIRANVEKRLNKAGFIKFEPKSSSALVIKADEIDGFADEKRLTDYSASLLSEVDKLLAEAEKSCDGKECGSSECQQMAKALDALRNVKEAYAKVRKSRSFNAEFECSAPRGIICNAFIEDDVLHYNISSSNFSKIPLSLLGNISKKS